MTVRGTLIGICGIFWLAAVGCWLRARWQGSRRLTREGWLFVVLGLPFLMAGVFYSSSSYPDAVRSPTPTPAPALQAATPPVAIEPEAEEVPPPVDPRAHAAAVLAAQRAAVARYPDLGVEGTAFNAEFVQIFKRRQARNPAFFNDPGWPLTLAEEIARTMPQR